MRLFVAIDIPGSPLLDRLALRLGSVGKGLMPTRTAYRHITLKFIGDPGTDPKTVIGTLEGLDTDVRSFEMKVGEFGSFPGWKRPSVIWIGFDHAEPLSRLSKDIDNALNRSIGTSIEKRKFKPHLTVARVKGPFDKYAARSLLETTVKELKDEDYTIDVDEFHLFSSTLTRSGPVYDRIGSFPLEE